MVRSLDRGLLEVPSVGRRELGEGSVPAPDRGFDRDRGYTHARDEATEGPTLDLS